MNSKSKPRLLMLTIALLAPLLLAARCTTLLISDGPSYDYGSKPLGSSTIKTFTITNDGDVDPATLVDISNEGLGLIPPFSLSGGTCKTGQSLPPKTAPEPGKCTIDVAFTPTRGAQAYGRLSVSYVANGLSGTDWIQLTGFGEWFSMKPDSLQAAGHPNVTYGLSLEGLELEHTGDDVKKITLDLPAGMLVNAEAANPKCTTTQFESDTCPSNSVVGSVSIDARLYIGAIPTLSATGDVYILEPDANSALTLGFIVRPIGYAPLFLRTTSVTAGLTPRTGSAAGLGATVVVDNVPRDVTTTSSPPSTVAATITNLTIVTHSRAGATQTGPYFTFSPTRCTTATGRVILETYGGARYSSSGSFTPMGCENVPFDPIASVSFNSSQVSTPTGFSMALQIPTDDAPIQQSHIRQITVDLPPGFHVNFPGLSFPAFCSETQLDSDTCPEGSRIGYVTAYSRLLPPEMVGDIYVRSVGNSVEIGLVLRGARGVTAVTRLRAGLSLDNTYLTATTLGLPQAPFESLVATFTAQMVANPNTCGPHIVNTTLGRYNGSSVTVPSTHVVTGCPTSP